MIRYNIHLMEYLDIYLLKVIKKIKIRHVSFYLDNSDTDYCVI